jgi:hypothetical protein
VRSQYALRATVLFALFVLLAWTPCARAEAPSWDEWPVERNAQLLQGGEVRLGLFGLDIGLHDRLQLGTLWPTWLLLAPNAHAKLLIVDRDAVNFGLESSLFFVNLAYLRRLGLDDVRGQLFVWSAELMLDTRLSKRVLFGLGGSYSMTHITSDYNQQSYAGTGAYDSLFARGHLTMRAARRWWLIVEGDWILHQLSGAIANVDMRVSEDVELTGRVRAVTPPLEPWRAYAVTVTNEVRSGPFGLRIGVGYGTFILPRVRIVVPRLIPYVTFDAFIRFGGGRDEPQPEDV